MTEEPHKEGRTVSEIQFRVVSKQQLALGLLDDQIVIDRALIDRLIALGLSEKDAGKCYADFEEDKILATIELVEYRASNLDLPALHSKAAFFKKAIRENYAESATKEQKDKEVVKAAQKAKAEAKTAAETEVQERIRKRGVEAKARLAEMPDEIQEQILDKFFAANPAIKRSMKVFVERSFPLWLADYFGVE